MNATEPVRATTEQLEQLRGAISSIVNECDWYDKIMPCMNVLRWKYSSPDGLKLVTIEMAKQVAEDNLRKAITEYEKSPEAEWIAVRTGGFEAKIEPGEQGIELTLKFVVEEVSTEGMF